MPKLQNALEFSHVLMNTFVPRGGAVIDATVGNGNDTVFLCGLLGESGLLFGFDIQQQALDRAAEKLDGIKTTVRLICDGHQNMKKYVDCAVDFIGFNLGFLPAGDRSVTTLCETTLPAIEAALSLLKVGGVCCVCAYPGHPEGNRELAMLTDFLQGLDCRAFAVVHYRLVNPNGHPPQLFAIQRCA